MDFDKEKVRVALRMRPLFKQEQNIDPDPVFELPGHNLLVHEGTEYKFDQVFGKEQGQKQVFSRLRMPKMVQQVLSGFSSTILAYGPPSSGKSYTLFGSQQQQGIVQMAIERIYSKLLGTADFLVQASYLEIYNEQIRDLLNPKLTDLACRWNPSSGFYVQNLVVVSCQQIDQFFSLIHEGSRNRKKLPHFKDSSRSHTILMVWVKSLCEEMGKKIFKYGKFTFADLAWSQRKSKDGGVEIQSGLLNRSLLTLGRVIKNLAERRNQIPYRQSKLTMLLMDSLGGKSHTLMIAHVIPLHSHREQIASALGCAATARQVVNTPAPRLDRRELTIALLKEEVKKLRLENQQLRSQVGQEEQFRGGQGFIVQQYRNKIARIRTEVEEARKQLNQREQAGLVAAVQDFDRALTVELQFRLNKCLLLQNQLLSLLAREQKLQGKISQQR